MWHIKQLNSLLFFKAKAVWVTGHVRKYKDVFLQSLALKYLLLLNKDEEEGWPRISQQVHQPSKNKSNQRIKHCWVSYSQDDLSWDITFLCPGSSFWLDHKIWRMPSSIATNNSQTLVVMCTWSTTSPTSSSLVKFKLVTPTYLPLSNKKWLSIVTRKKRWMHKRRIRRRETTLWQGRK